MISNEDDPKMPQWLMNKDLFDKYNDKKDAIKDFYRFAGLVLFFISFMQIFEFFLWTTIKDTGSTMHQVMNIGVLFPILAQLVVNNYINNYTSDNGTNIVPKDLQKTNNIFFWLTFVSILLIFFNGMYNFGNLDSTPDNDCKVSCRLKWDVFQKMYCDERSRNYKALNKNNKKTLKWTRTIIYWFSLLYTFQILSISCVIFDPLFFAFMIAIFLGSMGFQYYNAWNSISVGTLWCFLANFIGLYYILCL
jgi:hypothetical protein